MSLLVFIIVIFGKTFSIFMQLKQSTLMQTGWWKAKATQKMYYKIRVEKSDGSVSSVTVSMYLNWV